MENIKNVIFDLGGVILNIDVRKTEEALERLGVNGFSSYMRADAVQSFFQDYETGKINDDFFVDEIRRLAHKDTQYSDVVAAWNSLLLDFPPSRIKLLQELKSKYRLFLLSNTNAIHYRQFQQQFIQQTTTRLDDLFEKAYYSHAINLRKPDVACYQYVITDNRLNPAETLFIDDSELNLEGAKLAGLATTHIRPGFTIEDIEW